MKKRISLKIAMILLCIMIFSSCNLSEKTEPSHRILLNKLGDENIGFRVALKTNIYSGWQNLDFTSNLIVSKKIVRFDEINTTSADIQTGLTDYMTKKLAV